MRLQPFLSQAEVETVHRGALRVLDEVGVRVQHTGLRARLAAVGGRCGSGDETVRFRPSDVEREIADAPKVPPREGPAGVSLTCGVYQSQYLDPETGRLGPFDEMRLAAYVALARCLPEIGRPCLLGVPFVPADIPAACLPLAEKLYAWKYGADPGGTVQQTELCAPLLDLFACHASAHGCALSDVFTATGFLLSPLRLASPECEQLLFFHERGLRMGIGHQPMQGATAPVTFTGALVLALAEQLFLFLLRRSLWQGEALSVHAAVSTTDMRQGISCYGRPEQQRMNAAFGDVGRFYGCASYGHTGLTDAKLPSAEAGAQKAMGALITALATGWGSIEAGLLGMDEVCSPVQMVLDHDLAGALVALLAPAGPFGAADVSAAVDLVAAVGPGGGYLGADDTAARFRTSLWTPATWSGEFLGSWKTRGEPIDADAAREIALEQMRAYHTKTYIDEDEERELRRIIAGAAQQLAP